MPLMIFIPFYFAQYIFHYLEDLRLVFIVDVSLEQFDDVQAIAFVVHKFGEEHVEPVVYRNEFIPVPRSATDGRLEESKTLFAKVVRFCGTHYISTGKTSTVERNTDTRRKNRIYEAGCVADKHKIIPTDLLHRIAVVTLILQWADLLGCSETSS